MAVFFACIIIIGSILLLFSLFLILNEKRRLHDYREDAREKKDDLVKTIEDAELLIDEMNRFSDYVVSNLEQKYKEFSETLHEADLRIEAMNSCSAGSAASKVAFMTNITHMDASFDSFDEVQEGGGQPADAPERAPVTIDSQLLKKGKVIPFDVKKREIIKLSKSGLDSTQIAKLLNMGKGEIELIARMER
jgi:hypothetical protein